MLMYHTKLCMSIKTFYYKPSICTLKYTLLKINPETKWKYPHSETSNRIRKNPMWMGIHKPFIGRCYLNPIHFEVN